MTVLELRLVLKNLPYGTDEASKAREIINREIKLRTTNYVTGERLPDEPQKEQ